MEITNENIQRIYQLDPENADHFIKEAIDYYCCSLQGKPRPVFHELVPKLHFLEIASDYLKMDDIERRSFFESLNVQIGDDIRTYFDAPPQQQTDISEEDSESAGDWNDIDRQELEKELIDRDEE